MKVYQFLEQLFRRRITSNEQIGQYMPRIAQSGLLDEPKKNALITEILKRLAQIEDSVIVTEQIIPEEIRNITNTVTNTTQASDAFVEPEQESSWNEIRMKAKELGVFDKKLKKDELLARIAEKK